MVPNLSTQSSDSDQSFRSSMSSVGDFSSASPNTNFSHTGSPAAGYYDNSYNDQYYDLDVAQYPSQSPIHHPRFCPPIPTNTWLSTPNLTPPANHTHSYSSGYATTYQSSAHDTRPASVTYPAQPDNTVHTISSLGWPKNTPILKLYDFVNKGKESFFELINSRNATSAMPLKVFLSDPT